MHGYQLRLLNYKVRKICAFTRLDNNTLFGTWKNNGFRIGGTSKAV
jgi:hypothetical protein